MACPLRATPRLPLPGRSSGGQAAWTCRGPAPGRQVDRSGGVGVSRGHSLRVGESILSVEECGGHVRGRKGTWHVRTCVWGCDPVWLGLCVCVRSVSMCDQDQACVLVCLCACARVSVCVGVCARTCVSLCVFVRVCAWVGMWGQGLACRPGNALPAQ